MSSIPFISMIPNIGEIPSQEDCQETCLNTLNGVPLINQKNLCICFVPPKSPDNNKMVQQVIMTQIKPS